MLLQLLEPGQTPLPHTREKGPAIGIDLGTTHSLVALSQEGKVIVLPDEAGQALLPSIVYLKDGLLTSSLSGDPISTTSLRSFKRFMTSKEISGSGVHEQMHRFTIEDKTVTPVEASATILKTLKSRAENYTGQIITQAVITVPAYFDDAARTATKDAARLAGLDVLRLINEPTAAALAYGLETRAQGIYAIYDLGGGTFDFSLLRLEGEVFQVLATGGDTYLGGDDFDALVAGTFLPSSPDPFHFCPQARLIKEHLSTHDQWHGIVKGRKITVLRSDLENLVSPLINRTFSVCRDVLRQGQISLSDIKGIVLVGGSTRMPLVRQKVATFFNQEPLINLNPDEVVAQGAAFQAEALTKGSHRLLLDVTPLSLGLETYGGIVEKIIPRNSPIPTTQIQEFTTYQDNQTAMSFHIVQGERELAQDCRSLATFHLRSLPARKAGLVRIRVVFTIDADGILTVHAQESESGIQQTMEIKPGYGLTENELLQMIEASYQNADQDVTERAYREAQVEAQRLIAAVEDALNIDSSLLNPYEQGQIHQALEMLKNSLNNSVTGDIKDHIELLKETSNVLAERRMNQAISQALKGKEIASENIL